jgi:hypothetical protein
MMDHVDKLLHQWFNMGLLMASKDPEDLLRLKELDIKMIKRIKRLPADYRSKEYWEGGFVDPLLLEIVTYLKDKYPLR